MNLKMEKVCPCGNSFYIIPSKYDRTKYCSKTCFYKYRKRPKGLKYECIKENKGRFLKGQKAWNKGKESSYKKDNPGYYALHEWVRRWKKDPKKCEICQSKKNLEWSNISGLYKRDLNDWQRLCKKCHSKYDFLNFGTRKIFYESQRI